MTEILTAKQAKEIALDTEKAVNDRILKDFIPVIKSHADKGEFECFIHVGCTPTYSSLDNLSKLDLRVVAKLKTLSYSVKYSRDGLPYVPRGLQDDEGGGTMHQNFGFTINW